MASLSGLSLRERLVVLRPELVKIAMTFCETDEDAEDFVQDRIVRLLANEKDYYPEQDPDGSYIKNKIVESTMIARNRKRQQMAELTYSQAWCAPHWDPLTVLNEHPGCDEAQRVREYLLASIPPEHVEILIMARLKHIPAEDISRLTGLSKWQIRNITYYQAKNMRRKAKLLGLLPL